MHTPRRTVNGNLPFYVVVHEKPLRVKTHSIAEIEWCIDCRENSKFGWLSGHTRRQSLVYRVRTCIYRTNVGNDWMGRQTVFAVRSTPSWTKTTRHEDSKTETPTAGRWRGRARVTTQHNRKRLILTFCCTHSLCVLDDLIVEKEFRSFFCRCLSLHVYIYRNAVCRCDASLCESVPLDYPQLPGWRCQWAVWRFRTLSLYLCESVNISIIYCCCVRSPHASRAQTHTNRRRTQLPHGWWANLTKVASNLLFCL